MLLFLTKKMQPLILIALSMIAISLLPLVCTASILKSDNTPETLRADSPDIVKNQLKKASNLINTGLYREAETILLKFENDSLWQGKTFFLLGRLYKKEGSFEKSKNYLMSAAASYPLLRDYALKLLADVYIATDEFDKAIETVRQIKSRILQQERERTEITALLALKREGDAMETLFHYIKSYPLDWDSKLTLAKLLKNQGETDKAIHFFKDIYINAVSLSAGALKELEGMKADKFTKKELLKRADKLFENADFQNAETTYKEALKGMNNPMKDRIRFAIGMCQFRLKQYKQAAQSFNHIKTPEALYWQAKALYRSESTRTEMNEREEFDRIIRKFEKSYPRDKHLALLLLMSAHDLRRKGNLTEAENIFKRVLDDFPEKSEDALWGIGWMNYTAGNYKSASRYFSKLASFVRGESRYKYLYWKARCLEKLADECISVRAGLKSGDNEDTCSKDKDDYFSKLPFDESYYGYLIRLRSELYMLPDKIEISKPEMPKGEVYEKIEALAFLGMRDEAVNEITAYIPKVNNLAELLYLGYKAMELREYSKIIAIIEGIKDKEFSPLSYPLGYWDIVRQIAEAKNLDPYIVVALIREESRFDPMAVSWAGAIGLMQLIPSTANRLNDEVGTNLSNTSELHDVEKNILLGTHYLSQLIKEFKKIPFALAAYNAGENAMRDWLVRFNNKDVDEFIEEIPYRETRRYVKKVLRSYWHYRAINGLPVDWY